ncbi:MAG: peptidylprolyl isomerase [Gaiellaceae bacterium]
MQKTISLLALALALAASGCGGEEAGKPDVPPGAIAIVGEFEIARTEFARLIEQAKKTFEAQEQDFPEAGTPEYEDVKSSVVKSLVEEAQWGQEAAEMGIKVTDQEVTKRLDELKEQFFQGDQKKYEEELERQGLTEQQVRDEIRSRVLSEKIYNSVTKSVKVTDPQIQAYYKKNEAQFEQPESREVRHILVKSKAKGQDIYRQLQNGASFATLAKKFTEDEASKAEGGKMTAQKGRTVAPFDKFVFDAETGDLSEPIKTEFGWHVIEVLSDVKPKSVTPLEDVKESISTTLLQQRQNAAMRAWVADLTEKYADETAYAPGFAPAPSTTGTGTGTTTETG